MSDQPRNWMTADEFLAQVEAYRRLRSQQPLKASRPFVPGPFVRTYILNPAKDFTLQKNGVGRMEAKP